MNCQTQHFIYSVLSSLSFFLSLSLSIPLSILLPFPFLPSHPSLHPSLPPSLSCPVLFCPTLQFPTLRRISDIDIQMCLMTHIPPSYIVLGSSEVSNYVYILRTQIDSTWPYIPQPHRPVCGVFSHHSIKVFSDSSNVYSQSLWLSYLLYGAIVKASICMLILDFSLLLYLRSGLKNIF